MQVIRFIISILMAIIMPINSFFASVFNVDGNLSFTENVTAEKLKRNMGDFNPMKNDIFVDAAFLNGDGSEAKPFNSIVKAKEKAKVLRKNGIDDKITIWIRGGEYFFDKTLKFDSYDAGNVVYRAYPNEKVAFTGAVSLTQWYQENVNGIPVFVSNVPDNMYFDSVVKDGITLPKTRYPETGYIKIEKEDHSDALFTDETSPWEYTLGDNSFIGNMSFNPESIKNIQNVSVRILHYWVTDFSYLSAYDAESNKYYLKNSASMTIKQGDRYYFENIFSELNSPGEWYLDSGVNKLYYVPRTGDTVENTVINACVNSKLISISDVNDIEFFGITFCNTNSSYPDKYDELNTLGDYGIKFPQAEIDVDAAVEVTKAQNINFKNCDFLNICNTALKFNKVVKNSNVTGCLFENIGGTGVFINGHNANEDEQITENIRVINNKIQSYGKVWLSAIGVLITNARNCTVQNNEISDGYYTAISVGWVWGYGYSVTCNNKIQDNLIYNIGQGWLSDMGGIYTLGIQNGTVISGNVIHHVAADTNEGGYGGWGIYLDEGSSNIVAENNLVYSCGSHSFHLHYGKDNIVRNNIFALSENGQIKVSRKEEHVQFKLENNIILSNDSLIYASFNGNNFIDNSNIYWDLQNRRFVVSSKYENKDLWNLMYRADVKAQGYYNNAVFENPQFKDPINGDFTIADGNEAIAKIEFVPWNYTKAGTTTKIENKT